MASAPFFREQFAAPFFVLYCTSPFDARLSMQALLDRFENTLSRFSKGQRDQYREVLVRPYDARREILLVVLACATIIILMGIRFSAVSSKSFVISLRPYQRLDTELTDAGSALYRTLLAGVTDILTVRDQEGLWPEAALLQMEQIPPFDSQLLSPALRGYTWIGYDGGSWIDYLGQDTSGQQPVSFILRLIYLHAGYHPHPHPGIDYDPERLVAAQVWFFPQAKRAYPGERLPEAGWFWIVRPDDPILIQSSSQASVAGNEQRSPTGQADR